VNVIGTKAAPPATLLLTGTLVLLAATAAPASAYFFTLYTPAAIQCHVRSQLAEASGDRVAAIAWAESVTVLDSRSSFARSRVALLCEEIGEDVRALEWGEQALGLDSLNADAAMLVGRMRLRSGESAQAVRVLTPPLRQLGAMPELYALRALAHELNRNYEAALADLKRTDVLLPDFAWIATGILGLALEDGRLEEANSALRLALELKPGDARTLALGVSLAQRRGDLALEETLLRELALGGEPRPEHVASLAAFLFREGKSRELDELLAWADERGMREDDLRIDAGQELMRAGHYRAALGAVKPLKRDTRAVPIRSRAYLALGEEKKALEGYRRPVEGWTFTREESLVLAFLEIRVGDRDQGIRTLEGVRRGPMESPRQVLAASLCYSLLGHPEMAVELIRESAARGVSSPSVYQELGSAATVMGDSLLAQWAWERLRDLGRETSECLYFLGSAELAQGNAPRAIQTLSRAIQLNPKNGKALLLLGSVRQKKGQLEMARELLILASQCPETATEANRALARVCKSLRLDTEAREAEARARSGRPSPPTGLSLFQSR
jgi:tetratricopeptide (TPR) repeat protein